MREERLPTILRLLLERCEHQCHSKAPTLENRVISRTTFPATTIRRWSCVQGILRYCTVEACRTEPVERTGLRHGPCMGMVRWQFSRPPRRQLKMICGQGPEAFAGRAFSHFLLEQQPGHRPIKICEETEEQTFQQFDDARPDMFPAALNPSVFSCLQMTEVHP